MLNALRKSAKTWVAKLLLLLLVLSFAVWGISDQMLNGGDRTTVLRAGDTTVSAMDYRLAYDRQLNVFSQQIGQRISREQAQLFGIENQVLGQLIAGVVFDEQARAMQLGLSKDRLAGLIAQDPAFQGVNGQFNRSQFNLVLNQVGMREEDYIRTREQLAVRQQVAEAVSDGIIMPDTFLQAFQNHQGQTRDIEFIEIGRSTIADVGEPDAAALAAFFEDNKADYSAPEYRTFTYVRLTPADIADPASLTDSDVRAEYDGNRARYSTPEQRTIQQLVFPDRDAAKTARDAIVAGQSFEEAVAATGRTMQDVTLGTFTRDQVPDGNLAEAAFELADENSISDVVDGAFGAILVRVSAITPETVQPFDAVAGQIREELALAEASDILLNVSDSYEDARAGGATMADAARDQRLNMVTIADVDSTGTLKSGEKADLPDAQQMMSQVFSADIGVENPPLAVSRDGFLWYEVTSVEDARDRALDEVRDRVVEDWKTTQITIALDAEAQRIAGALESGTPLAELTNEGAYRSGTKFGLLRNGDDVDFGARGLDAVFDVGPDGTGVVANLADDGRIAFKVTSITNPIGGVDALREDQVANITQGLAGDLLDQLVNRLQLEFPVAVNQAAIDFALTN